MIIAGGGTGGHIFPGIAVAETWQKQGGDILFVGTPRGQEKDLVPRYGFRLILLKVGRLKGGGIFAKLKTLAGLPFAMMRCALLLWREKPDFVLGIGGYASGPMCVTARLFGYQTGVMEQNVHPGLTNRVLGKFVHFVFLSFAKASSFFQPQKVWVFGNPIRSQITYSNYQPPQDVFRIFLFGGSQGALRLNEIFLQAVEELKDIWPELHIVHQATKFDLETISHFYASRSIKAEVKTFFDDMNSQYSQAHLIICRAGAGTVTELALSGRPSILVPYPLAADDHQKRNAEVFVEQNAAWMMEEKKMTAQDLAAKIRLLKNQPEHLVLKAENMKAMARPQADEKIVKHIKDALNV